MFIDKFWRDSADPAKTADASWTLPDIENLCSYNVFDICKSPNDTRILQFCTQLCQRTFFMQGSGHISTQEYVYVYVLLVAFGLRLEIGHLNIQEQCGQARAGKRSILV